MTDNILGGEMNPFTGNEFSDLVDGIDWNEVWRYRMAGWFSTVNDEAGDPFRHRGRNLASSPVHIRRKVNERIKTRIAEMSIQPGENVLVIGGGPHVFAEAVAKMGCRVTVVEHSPEMATALRDFAESTNVPVRVIEKRWEEVLPDELQEHYDIVVASHALWMTDIGPAIEKMNAVAGSVYLYWYLTTPVWAQVMSEIWRKVHGRAFRFAPTAECLYHVLLQKEIFANISIEEVDSNHFYGNIGEALEAFRTCTQFSEVCQDNVVRNYLRTRLTLADTGFTLKGKSYDAKIWWRSMART